MKTKECSSFYRHGVYRFSSRPSQEGSALLFALMGLVFLTIVGLSLTMVTETEMLIGTNEQVAKETFYAAELGVAVSTAQILTENSMQRKYFALEALDGDQGTLESSANQDRMRTIGNRTLGYSVDFSNIYPVISEEAPYSNANEGEDPLLSYFFVTDIRARRMAWPTANQVPECEYFQDAIDLGTGSTVGTTPTDMPDEFENILSEQRITYGFFVSPVKEVAVLPEGYTQADRLGCDPPKDYDDYVARLDP